MDKLGIIIQARLGSTRLPMKMIIPFFNEKGILELIIEKIKDEFPDIKIVVATSDNPIDDQLETLCNKLAVSCFRGSENNVLNRFINAAELNQFSKIIRVCADNPFLNMSDLKKLISKSKKSEADYISFQTSKNKPTIITHYGFWAEAVSLAALQKVQNNTKKQIYQEHVTNYIYSYPERFTLEMINISKTIEKKHEIRMTLDTAADFLLLQEIYEKHSVFNGSAEELVSIVSQNQEWLNQMQNQILINQK